MKRDVEVAHNNAGSDSTTDVNVSPHTMHGIVSFKA